MVELFDKASNVSELGSMSALSADDEELDCGDIGA